MYNKHHLFEVYSLADEEIDDVNELQDEYKSESVSSEEKCLVFDFEEGFLQFLPFSKMAILNFGHLMGGF
ncbi:hypothetical protein C1645_817132 [Glomus cerebriforme]|uniref:Uncharacterized protein n=1 Tax=Glomus cerebriforme TaxID=658196 RepID=A0A397TFK8_9GLOM|nr:hypothetical protein C1645_817132 [Glomus cerebriforme]